MKKTQAKLKQYQDAIDASNIVSKTDINGIITFVNDEFCKISGYSRQELIGSPHNIVRHPDVKKSVFKKLWETILAKKVYKGIVKNLSKDGRAFYLNATIIPILDDNGEIEEFVAIRHDVTNVILLNEHLTQLRVELNELNQSLENKVKEQTKELTILNANLEKRVEEEIAKNEQSSRIMFRQSRLASMGEMMANIAHQWRQPLSELSIDLFKMKQNLEDKDGFLDTYEHAKQVIKNMSNTIDDFRNFFNANKPVENFLVSSCVDDAMIMLKGTLDRNDIKIDVKSQKNVFVYGHQSELTQVFMNILINAKDAFKNSEIKSKKIQISIKSNDKFAIIDIKDNAGAIKDEIMERIFEPYFTTKHKSSGTGLGLYMSKMIVEHMKGEIIAENLKNWVNFKIILPLAKEEESV
ncbi:MULTISPECIES: PAS domain-containing sensor histidine kinase [unclassified Campylobacter]|uniref:PAS domain-containing sensor histidine kinase n=1 Tax=unclassified Campylobacter TaxID=2593542 RepID=UPI0022E9DCFC|nr:MULTISPECIES: PAS domain-containing sensor histidine kinase [unclassified Campylobacter]MDA3056075.1 PAS domain-containing sensor histidine kinase [Campylobacter sp. CN_NA1]MDA3065220.1 PAS domain-containing sensor histidine kinase [Campylobacter sp. CN_NE4]MDA3068045.1 PAS domain-containing sensor histidine kinase [Campylobacter sp. CN_NE3]MDA3082674.1 PAS domain-containing sensor histidine kinase [Campylobacter sp. CN_EL2]MDA3083588.1 PAS domain-containing sensor histidine kinase [Campylo